MDVRIVSWLWTVLCCGVCMGMVAGCGGGSSEAAKSVDDAQARKANPDLAAIIEKCEDSVRAFQKKIDDVEAAGEGGGAMILVKEHAEEMQHLRDAWRGVSDKLKELPPSESKQLDRAFQTAFADSAKLSARCAKIAMNAVKAKAPEPTDDEEASEAE